MKKRNNLITKSTVWKLQKCTFTLVFKKFREIKIFTKEVTKWDVDFTISHRYLCCNIFSVWLNFSLFFTLWKCCFMNIQHSWVIPKVREVVELIIFGSIVIMLSPKRIHDALQNFPIPIRVETEYCQSTQMTMPCQTCHHLPEAPLFLNRIQPIHSWEHQNSNTQVNDGQNTVVNLLQFAKTLSHYQDASHHCQKIE